MSQISAIRPKNYREKIFFRKLRVQIDGSPKVEHGLTQIRGIGRRFAQAVVLVAGLSSDLRIGILSEKELGRLEEIILKPIENGIPYYFVNRKKDLRTGEDLHITGNMLEITTKRDVDRMRRMRSYKGIRHQFRLKVRGQRTKSTGRHGLVVGVMRRSRKESRREGD